MKWFKVETNDILLGGYTNNQIAILIKYKALYAQLEDEPNDRQLATFFTKKEINELKKLQSCNEVVQESIKSELKVKQNHREVDLKNKQKNNNLVKNSTSNLLPRIDKIREDKNIKENLIKEKIKLDEVFNWESLFSYWEQNKKGGKYKNAESRNRQLAKLKQLTNDNYDFAKDAILFCLDNNYQGFTDGQKLYYRGTDVRGDSNTEETVTIDESLKFDETMPEFKDMTFDDCCRAYDWLQDKMYLQVITKPKFVELVRKFKGAQ